ncbi:MAG: hypothetical protein GC204_21025 [Chloroflexi bacterium]|nr:hypothetical protein [Chloroflexota bacterium]
MHHKSRFLFAAGLIAVLAIATALQAASLPTSITATSTATTEATAESTAESTLEPTAETTAESTEIPVTCDRLNLNTLTNDELLATIPGFSSRMVREFQEYRPYVSILQFRKEIGKYVDQPQVTEWEQYVYVPVVPNDSDQATLMQLPGVDETIADALIAARPYATDQDFLDALEAQVTPEEFAQSSCYLDLSASA